MHLLSQAEVYTYYLLRWDDSVVDIREQYPLELEDTLKIADHLGYKHPHDRKTSMTTDFLVTYREKDGTKTYKAYSVKASKEILQNDRTVEIQRIEMAYWNLKGIPFEIVFKEDMNRIKVGNIEAVMDYWDAKKIKTDIDMIKYLIAHKKMIVDMETAPLDFTDIARAYRETEKRKQDRQK